MAVQLSLVKGGQTLGSSNRRAVLSGKAGSRGMSCCWHRLVTTPATDHRMAGSEQQD